MKSLYKSLASFRHELRAFLRFSEAAARRHGLTPLQYQALLAIGGHPGDEEITVGELARHLLIAAHGAVGLVDRLETARLVRRRRSPRDRRKVRIGLTPLGRRRLEALASVHREELRRAGPLLMKVLKQVESTELR